MARLPTHGSVRINRFLSMCGITSRRKAEELVLAGKVTVNGHTLQTLATRVDPRRDRVVVNGREIHPVQRHLYLVMNKPKDTITTLRDERGRNTVIGLVRARERVFPIGRLDRNTTGVLLLTSDGELAHKLMHPSTLIQKSYQVTCNTPVSPHHVDQLRKGTILDGKKAVPAEILVLPGGGRRVIGVVLHEGRKRQVRRMFEQLGYEVVKLDRVAYGPITKQGLSRGETRSLTRSEVRRLKELAGVEDER